MTDHALQPAAFFPLGCSLAEVAIEIDPGDPPPATPAMLARWAEACAANPRLFNGPILRYMAHSCSLSRPRRERVGERAPSSPPPSCLIAASRDTYQRYATQHHDPATADPARDIYHLAVTGVVTARDAGGNDAVVFGRRGASTFIYPHMWEHAPGGGLESANIYDQLLTEMEEELGLRGLIDGSRRAELLEPPGADDVLGLTTDPTTPSVDVIVRVRLREGAEHAMNTDSWEYGASRLVPVAALPEFMEREGETNIIPPTLAIWRGMGWV